MQRKNKRERNVERSFVFRLTGCLHTAIFADTVEALYLRVTSGHYANIGEEYALFKDREPLKTLPYPAGNYVSICFHRRGGRGAKD